MNATMICIASKVVMSCMHALSFHSQLGTGHDRTFGLASVPARYNWTQEKLFSKALIASKFQARWSRRQAPMPA